jgi:hypothetical protein
MSTPGLGKNSPVVLSQSRSNFEALIDRHGQYTRWRIAKKCPCVTTNNYSDIHCPKCGGAGYIYDYQRTYDDVFRATVRDLIIEIPETYTDSTILEVYDSKGNQFQFCRCGDFIQIRGGPRPLNQNEYVDVRFRETIVKHIENVTLEKAGCGYYRVPGILTAPSKLEGVYYQTAGDVIGADGLQDNDGNPVEITGYRRDMILTNSTAETLKAASVDYILPFKFIVLAQDLNKEDLALVQAHNGNAVCTYPYMFDVAEDDVITVLSGTMTNKIALTRQDDDHDDVIPEYFVSKVKSLDTKSGSFTEGEDFILTGTNRIHWIGEEKPEPEEIISIVFTYYPTYRVAKNIPMLRTSEDQRIPRKVILKLYAAFAEAEGVNRND